MTRPIGLMSGEFTQTEQLKHDTSFEQEVRPRKETSPIPPAPVKQEVDGNYAALKAQGFFDETVEASVIATMIAEKSFLRKSGSPEKGSLLRLAMDHATTKATFESYFKDRFLKELGLTFMQDDVDMPSYVLMRLIYPHTASLDIAEAVGIQAQQGNKSTYEILSAMTGHSITKRSDIMKLVKKIAARSPKLLDLINF